MRRVARRCSRIGAVAGAVTVAGMIATPLLPQGGRARRVLSTVVVVGSFATTAANAVRRWGAPRAVSAGVGDRGRDDGGGADRHPDRPAVRPLRLHHRPATAGRPRAGDRAARVVRDGTSRTRSGPRRARRALDPGDAHRARFGRAHRVGPVPRPADGRRGLLGVGPTRAVPRHPTRQLRGMVRDRPRRDGSARSAPAARRPTPTARPTPTGR